MALKTQNNAVHLQSHTIVLGGRTEKIGIFGIYFSVVGIFMYPEYRRRYQYRYFKISDIGSVFQYTDPRLIYITTCNLFLFTCYWYNYC